MTALTDLSWWNLIPQHMSPTLIEIGSFPIRWYGLMYLAAFYTAYKVMWNTIVTDKLPIDKKDLEDLSTWIIAGILIGARLGYVVFYNLPYYSQHPLEAILPFSFNGGFHFTGISGMSYHGGLIGAFISSSILALRRKWNYWTWINLGFMAAPLGYTWGRLGNFINGELYGRVTDSPIGMLFPMDETQQLRHPSQLYEMVFEGVVTFLILRWFYKKPAFKQHMMALYLILYGSFRFGIEYFREPDAHIGLDSLGFSRGQLLCFVMIVSGVTLGLVRHFRLSKSQAKT